MTVALGMGAHQSSQIGVWERMWKGNEFTAPTSPAPLTSDTHLHTTQAFSNIPLKLVWQEMQRCKLQEHISLF